MDNFESEIRLEMKPVLLACIRRGFELREQIDLLEKLSRKYTHNLKICLLFEGLNEAYRTLAIEGTPTFLLFFRGEEKGRMLGKVKMETLSTFVFKSLQQELDDPSDPPFQLAIKRG
jgi:hypothetical protein